MSKFYVESNLLRKNLNLSLFLDLFEKEFQIPKNLSIYIWKDQFFGWETKLFKWFLEFENNNNYSEVLSKYFDLKPEVFPRISNYFIKNSEEFRKNFISKYKQNHIFFFNNQYLIVNFFLFFN